MREMVHTIRVLLVLAKMQISASMMYRTNFWGVFFADLTFFMIQLLFFNVIVQNRSIGGWNVHHLTVFIGTFIALNGLYMATYFFGIIVLPEKIRTGALDLAIVKPVNTLLYTTFGTLNMGAFLVFFVGVGIVLYGGARLGALSISGLMQFAAVFSLMYVLMYAFMLLLRCASFWLTRVSVFNNFENTFVEFAFRLPLPAIHGAWKILLFVLIPYGLMANMPAAALFGPFGFKEWILCVGVTAFFSGVALFTWCSGRRIYDSASS